MLCEEQGSTSHGNYSIYSALYVSLSRMVRLISAAGLISVSCLGVEPRFLYVVQFSQEKTLISHIGRPSVLRVETTSQQAWARPHSSRPHPSHAGTSPFPSVACSFCVARGTQECHYSIRSIPGMSSSMITTLVPASGEVGEVSLPAGLSFWATEEGAGDADADGEKREAHGIARGGSGTAVGVNTGLVLPLKR